jgi:hypothetical protein
MTGGLIMRRDLQKEIAELGILGIETSDGVLTESVIADAIDAHRQTLSKLDLDKISQNIEKDMKAFSSDA